MRSALLQNDIVVNVIEYDPETVYDPSPYELVTDVDESVNPGWVRQTTGFAPPPETALIADPERISSGSTETSVVTYVNTHDDAPSQVTFNVNGATAVASVVEGRAQLEIDAPYPTEIVVVCEDLNVKIVATEV